jgi:hypothetical protein
MAKNGAIVHILVLLFSRHVSFAKEECRPRKTGCVFTGRNQGWVPLEYGAKQRPLYPPMSDSWRSPNSSIHVSISSFRDQLCPRTLRNIFTKSLHPHRITVSVVQQNEQNDLDCLEEYCRMEKTFRVDTKGLGPCPFRDHVQMDRVKASEAQGPTWARSRGSRMIQPHHEFCLQVSVYFCLCI